jgi:hypothetical protein
VERVVLAPREEIAVIEAPEPLEVQVVPGVLVSLEGPVVMGVLVAPAGQAGQAVPVVPVVLLVVVAKVAREVREVREVKEAKAVKVVREFLACLASPEYQGHQGYQGYQEQQGGLRPHLPVLQQTLPDLPAEVWLHRPQRI